MASKVTKAEMESKIEQLIDENRKLRDEVYCEHRQLEDAIRQRDRCVDARDKLIAVIGNGKKAIEQHLTVRYDKSAYRQSDFVRGQELVEPDMNDEIRFLRFLHEMLDKAT